MKGSRKDHRTERTDTIKIPNAFPALVSKEVFDRVQAKMDIMRRHCERGRNHAKEVYLLSGLIYCGKCGGAFIGQRGRGLNKKRYAYYECGLRDRSKECDCKIIRKDTIEQAVLSYIKQEVFSEESKIRIREIFKEYLQKRPDEIKKQKDFIKKELFVIQNKINNIIKFIEDGRATKDMADRLDQLGEQRDLLKGKMAKLESRESTKIVFDEVNEMLNRAEKVADDVHDPEILKNLFTTFVDRVIVFDDEVEINLKVITPT
jgi:site-specific DNA recombinase